MILMIIAAIAGAMEPACPPSSEAFGGPQVEEVKPDPRLKGLALIVVEKEKKRLGLYAKGSLVDCWPIGLATDPITGSPPVGHKQREGDLKTPEGWYTTSDKTWSSYYHAIYIHYPNEADTKAALKDERLTVVQAQAILAALAAGKVPSQNTPLGGELLIHGGGSETDWTLGCVAMNNKDIDALRANLPLQVKTDILLLP